MRVLHERCCGLDIHQRFVVACLLATSPDGAVHKEVRTYSPMTNDLLAFADWLRAESGGPVVMESTGSYWRPVFNLLEEPCAVLVVNAYHVKAAPGRKTDVKDAEWLADWLRLCCVTGSCAPASFRLYPLPHSASPARPHALSHPPGRRARAAHQPAASRPRGRQHPANIQPPASSPPSSRTYAGTYAGSGAREILQRLLDGETDARALAELAEPTAWEAARQLGQRSPKRDALAQAVVGRLEAHHVFLPCSCRVPGTREQLAHLASLDAAIARVDAELEARLAAEHEAIALLETIPGVGQRTAEVLVAEIGMDLSRFKSAEHRPSTWPPGPGCAQATPRAAADASVAGHGEAPRGCGVRWLRSPPSRAG